MIRRYLLLFILGSFILSGCATMFKGKSQTATTPQSLEVAALLKFDDVPVPNGFSFIPSESFAFQTESVRVGLLKYVGKANPDAIVQFYKEQMPLYNWKTVNIIEYERRVLNFEKNDQTCVVTIDAKGSKVFLVIAVSPRSQKEILSK